MDISLMEQAGALLESSRTPVIIIPKRPSSDALAAGLGLLLVLERLGKQARIVCPEFSLPPGHNFLPKSNTIEQELTNLQSFVIKVSVKDTKLETLSYNLQGDELQIFLTPKQGFFRDQDVHTTTGGYAYDLIVTLDTPNLPVLGAMYEQNAEFFYHTPLLNIDHHPTNERYGHVNLIDVVATSVSEIVFDLIKRLGIEHLDEQVATSLLTGIISKTKVFQSNSVTPRSLAIASHLVTSGARRDDIIRNLYQTKNLQTLKLWGRALTRLRTSPDQRVLWSTVTQADLNESKALPADAAGVLDELMVNAPAIPYTILFIEAQDKINVFINLADNAPMPNLPKEVTARSPQFYTGSLPGPLNSVVERILQAFGVRPEPSNHSRPNTRRP